MISEFEKKIKKNLAILGNISIEINLNLILKIEKNIYSWIIKNNEIKKIDNLIEKKEDKSEFYEIGIKGNLFKKYLNNECEFDDLFFGGHLKISASKNGYNSVLIKMLRNLNNEINLKLIKKNENFLTRETILVNFKKKVFKISKYCPHQNYSLKKALIDENGIVTCPAHGWKFDVVSGKCIKGDLSKKI
jgi:nitrite reductase/ring-hydroxylating ferredoxin subunit